MITLEMAWFLCPILAIIRQIQGTWGGVRWVSLIAIFIFLIIYRRQKLLQGLLSLGLFYLFSTLPITLYGSSVTEHWYNWLWIWVLGFIHGLWALPLFLDHKLRYILTCIVPMFIYGMVITLSNISSTAQFFPWKLCEGIMGFAIAYPFAFMVNIKNEKVR